MLILSRKKNDRIMIGDDITIMIVNCEDNRVKIGIDAPKHVRVFRKELIDTQEDNRAAAKTAVSGFDELMTSL